MPENNSSFGQQSTTINTRPDLIITGGGLAGLALSIQMANAGFSVTLIEKETYPFHRVCGEYISMESWNFLQSLRLDLEHMALPKISKLMVSSPSGKLIRRPLLPGGFGISRYTLDAALAAIARSAGVQLLENSRVTDISRVDEEFFVRAGPYHLSSRVVVCSFGKRSNLDLKWKRNFVQSRPDKLNNYVGIKYHIRYPVPEDTIALHNFENGYCGISRVEDGKSCLCYLTTAENLSRSGNDISVMEKNLLCKNPHLKKILDECDMLYDEPETISQISFSEKEQVLDHMLMVGDAAGMITPLCGNGMSMALHGSKIAALVLKKFLYNEIDRSQMETEYQQQWKFHFEKRLVLGRRIQSLFGHPLVTDLFISVLKPFPLLADNLIRRTHGQPF